MINPINTIVKYTGVIAIWYEQPYPMEGIATICYSRVVQIRSISLLLQTVPLAYLMMW